MYNSCLDDICIYNKQSDTSIMYLDKDLYSQDCPTSLETMMCLNDANYQKGLKWDRFSYCLRDFCPSKVVNCPTNADYSSIYANSHGDYSKFALGVKSANDSCNALKKIDLSYVPLESNSRYVEIFTESSKMVFEPNHIAKFLKNAPEKGGTCNCFMSSFNIYMPFTFSAIGIKSANKLDRSTDPVMMRVYPDRNLQKEILWNLDPFNSALET